MTDDEFWDRVEKTDRCWVWRGGHSEGYGNLTFRGKTERAHRVAWRLANGDIPSGLWVLHRCDNRPCVRPDHLLLGTHNDNMADMARKGRSGFSTHPEIIRRGEAHPRARLVEDDVRDIRARAMSGELKKDIAAAYGISDVMVSYICNGKAWRHVPMVSADDGGGA